MKTHSTKNNFEKLFIIILLLLCISFHVHSQTKEEVFDYLRSMGNGTWLFGQVATWVHNENPDIDDDSNWIMKVYDHTGKYPRYACITYDFDDDPFTDEEWNQGVKKIWDNGMIPGIYNFFANPTAGKGNWRDSVRIAPIFARGNTPEKTSFYQQMDRMSANLKWLGGQGVVVVYTPFVELNDHNKWHARNSRDLAVKLYRLVHDYYTDTKGLNNIIWAYHTTQGVGALEEYYPGDEYVDVIGKSAYGTGLIFNEYEWAVDKKKNYGKVIWWAELGIRGKSDPARDCFDVLNKLETSFPELAGFVFWSDAGFYNVVGNLNGTEFMEDPRIVTLK